MIRLVPGVDNDRTDTGYHKEVAVPGGSYTTPRLVSNPLNVMSDDYSTHHTADSSVRGVALRVQKRLKETMNYEYETLEMLSKMLIYYT